MGDLGWEDSLVEGMETHSSSCLENSHGQRSLVSRSPGNHKESDTTERLSIAHAEKANTISHYQLVPYNSLVNKWKKISERTGSPEVPEDQVLDAKENH